MQWSDISFSDRTIRQFAVLWMLFLAGLALWQGAGQGNTTAAIILAFFGLTLGSLGLVWPVVLRPVYAAWMVLVFPIGWLVSYLILAILYFGLFTPLGLVFRLMGWDPLEIRHPSRAKSYWKEREEGTEAKRYLRQY